jgi:outer membrane protein assembly factor BamB
MFGGRLSSFGFGALAVFAVAAALSIAFAPRGGDSFEAAVLAPTTTTSTTTTTTVPIPTTTTRPPFVGWVDPLSVGEPWGSEVEGLLTFRGSPTRTFYGTGPIPDTPTVRWTFPERGGLCSQSTVGGQATTWCGSGWTGQPAVFEREGRRWVVFGSYAAKVHFLDAYTGERILPDFAVGDIIKGSVTVDPDGYPIVYTGSRDNFFRAIAIDRDEPVELWKLSADAVSPTLWNNDWDGAALIIDDFLFEGGENSQIHIVKLNRGYDADGLVTLDPQLVFNAPGWDDELLSLVGNNVSIENSVAISGNTLYFANSGGLVQGWDISKLAEGGPVERVFRFWAGDDVDASIVIDDEAMLYVGVEYERGTGRSQELGQILKLDPSRPEDPLIWGVHERPYLDSGVWGTPALYRDLLIVSTDEGKVIGIDRATGEERWFHKLQGPTWQSPVVVDETLVIGDCIGQLHAFDVSDTMVIPPKLWTIRLGGGGCIESTPAAWDGWLYVATREGSFYAISNPE